MFKRCEKENKHIKFKQGYYVGDKIKDLKAALNIGAKPVLVRTGYGKETEADLNRWAYRELKKRTIIFDNLAEFVKTLE
jgi:D-glycero-D-manno-heptose 1,7-bisphosphate phosphatase